MAACKVLEPQTPSTRVLLILVGAALLGAGCEDPFGNTDRGPGDDDDDSSVSAGDDDDTSPAPDPLADVVGVFNLTNVVQDAGSSYVDFSGAFGTFVAIETDTLSPAAYLSTFSYGSEAAYWRSDLGGYPIPAEGESWTGDLYNYYPWVPSEQTWWDGGQRVGVGNYLSTRLDFEDVTAYQVDDPRVPGAASWSSGASLGWANDQGADLVESSLPGVITLPESLALVEPTEGSTIEAAAAHDFLVRWNPGTDGAQVTVGLLSSDSIGYVATVPDTGSHTIPSAVLRDTFGASTVDLIVARTLESSIPHPQGDILFRAREERRAELALLGDVVIEPSYAEAGQTVDLQVRWFTGSFNATSNLDFGEGITVQSITPHASKSYEAGVRLVVSTSAATGARDVVITTGAGSVTLAAGFSVLDLMPSDNCSTAESTAPLTVGSYASTTTGLNNDITNGLSCLPWTLNGSDATYPIFLSARETLVATMTQPAPADGALALLSTCGDAETAVACADSGISGDPETLVFTAESAGIYYLVIDSYAFTGTAATASAFDLEVAISQQVLTPAWISPGTSQYFQLSGEVSWSPTILPSHLNLGAGVTASASTPASSDSTVLEFQASALSTATIGPRDLSVADPSSGTQSFPEALWVTGWPVYDRCVDAVGATGLAGGEAAGYAVGATNTLGSIPCFLWPSVGPEFFFPLDLSATNSVTAAVFADDDAQLYILSDCNDANSCVDEAAIDDSLDGDWEYLIGWVPPAAGRYYLVVDLYSPPANPLSPWPFELNLSID